MSCEGRASHGVGRLGIDEVIELRLAFFIVAGDAHDVLAVGGGEIGVGVDESSTHALGVIDVLAEDDGFGKAIGRPEKLGDLCRDELGAFLEDQDFVVVELVVLAILDGWPYLSVCPISGRQPSRSLSRPMRITL